MGDSLQTAHGQCPRPLLAALPRPVTPGPAGTPTRSCYVRETTVLCTQRPHSPSAFVFFGLSSSEALSLENQPEPSARKVGWTFLLFQLFSRLSRRLSQAAWLQGGPQGAVVR